MGDRYALLIGNSEFQDENLPELAAPMTDVIEFGEVLERPDIAGFKTKTLLNVDIIEVRKEIAALFRNKHRDDLVLLYYTGHGLRDERGNLYLALPATRAADPTEISLEATFVRLQMDRSGSHRQVLILDCCHSGAFMRPGAKAAVEEKNLYETDFDPQGHGRFILAASAANESAFERDGRSIFTRHLVEALRTGEAAPAKAEITIHDLYEYVSRCVAAEDAPMRPRLWVDEQTDPIIIARNPTYRRMASQHGIGLLWGDDPYRALGSATRLVDALRQENSEIAADAERELLLRLSGPDNLPGFAKKVIRQAVEARRSASLEGAARANGTQSKRPSKAEFPLSAFRVVAESWCPELVRLPAGRFLMGSPVNEKGRYGDEGPQREVAIGTFAVGRYPVTFAEYDHFCRMTGHAEADDRGWGRGRMPAINLSWHDARAYVDWLSEKTEQRFRLPSEAEWEYAARAGTQTPYWWGGAFAAGMANTTEENRRQTAEVGTYPPNPWGLYDMLGNVWEWIEDIWHDSYQGAPKNERPWLALKGGIAYARVLRGGSWHSYQEFARAASRLGTRSDLRGDGLGFRIVLLL